MQKKIIMFKIIDILSQELVGFYFISLIIGIAHRRRLKTEEKAKIVAAAWGRELIYLNYFFAALAWNDDLSILFCLYPSFYGIA